MDGLLLDIDGVLSISWEPIAGSIEAMETFRREGIPVCLITNTTTHTRAALAETLRAAGFDVRPESIVTAVTATAEYLRSTHPGAQVFVLSDGDARADLDGVSLVDAPDAADVIVLGGASEGFTYAAVNGSFRRLMDGASLVAMHRNLFWKTADGFELDGGAYVIGLEAAVGVTAVVCGKPASAYFDAALHVLGITADRAAMVGDDIVNDVEGARAAGLTGILVRTGKYREGDLERGTADVVVDALADVPAWLGLGG
ncbi:MAG: TIGR01458 family HAD-type hydrolase [Actinomycetota bacterium]|nr:TIGR01458 family HAD-type hydrolase [Actinomycetota bacterium]